MSAATAGSLLRAPARGPARRLLVVSHACVRPVNRAVFDELADRGWDVSLVVPDRWNDAFAERGFTTDRDGSRVAILPRRVLLSGRPQRHVYLGRLAATVRALDPDVAFVEQEPFALAALEWSRALERSGIPFGLAAAENLDRPFPAAARAVRAWTLPRARFVAARSPSAAALARRWGARGDVLVVPHAVPDWPAPGRRDGAGIFTVGFAGRLVAAKGVLDLLGAVQLLRPPVRLVVVGDGPLRPALQAASTPAHPVEVMTRVGHDDMPAAYALMDVLVLPSRTTAHWAEQFGRVLPEAMACGVPVVGSTSGEIPWTIGDAGRLFAEGDVAALAVALEELRANEPARREAAERGRERARTRFSVAAAADALEGAISSAARVGAGVV